MCPWTLKCEMLGSVRLSSISQGRFSASGQDLIAETPIDLSAIFSTFTSDKSCHTMQTLKTSQFYFQAEPDFWLAMTVNAPYDTRTKEDGEYKEYRSDTVHGNIFRCVLEESYKMFRLFYGKFEESFVGETPEEKSLALQSKLEDFFSGVRLGHLDHNRSALISFTPCSTYAS